MGRESRRRPNLSRERQVCRELLRDPSNSVQRIAKGKRAGSMGCAWRVSVHRRMSKSMGARGDEAVNLRADPVVARAQGRLRQGCKDTSAMSARYGSARTLRTLRNSVRAARNWLFDYNILKVTDFHCAPSARRGALARAENKFKLKFELQRKLLFRGCVWLVWYVTQSQKGWKFLFWSRN